ncbi:MAG: IclR family transcriptional regulator [Chloroflexota bacterium]|nr:IclR family transcriptional regulator [Chloroflexota bacterium]
MVDPVDGALMTQVTAVPGTRSRTIDRAAFILTCFSSEDPHLTLAQIATKLNLNQSTVYRYVATLQATGLLERDERRGGYRLGLAIVELAGVVLNQIAVRREALPEMDRLRDDMGVLVNLAVRDRGDIVHIAHSAPQGWPVWVTTPGRRAVAHCTALGKVLLAHVPWTEVRETIEQQGWRPYTATSIQSYERLERELTEVQRVGYAIEDGERGDDSLCVGAPIRDHSGNVIASLSVSSTTRRSGQRLHNELVPGVVDAANRTSSRLGYSHVLGFE